MSSLYGILLAKFFVFDRIRSNGKFDAYVEGLEKGLSLWACFRPNY